MLFTSRDHRLLQWINGHGFVTADQAAAWMGVCPRIGRRRLKVLVEGGYLQRKRFGFNDPQFHWLTKQGWEISGDDLAPPKQINRVTYLHDQMLVDLSQKVVAHTKGDFVPERRLRAERQAGRKGRWRGGHVSDGLLYVGDKKPIAIELEVSLKERVRLRKIITDYVVDQRLWQVWYFVTNDTVKRAIERMTKPYRHFQVFFIGS